MGSIKVDPLSLEESFKLERYKRTLRTLSREELLADADQLLTSFCNSQKVIVALVHRVTELELAVNDGKGAPVADVHQEMAKELLRSMEEK